MELKNNKGVRLKCVFLPDTAHRCARIMAAREGLTIRRTIEIAIEEMYARENNDAHAESCRAIAEAQVNKALEVGNIKGEGKR